MQIAYRKCTLEDIKELVDIARTTFVKTFASHNEPDNFQSYIDKSFSEKKIKEELVTPGSEFYFASLQNEVIGYFKLNAPGAQTDHNNPYSIELERIYVREEYQNNGFGLKLMQEAIDISKRAKFKYMWLGVWEHNPGAIRFYERHGFEKFGEHGFYLGNDLQTDIMMKRDL